jgi:hypothetical protein
VQVVARAAVDYAPSPTDDSILQLPLKQELLPEDMTNVFGYPRDLRRRHAARKRSDASPQPYNRSLLSQCAFVEGQLTSSQLRAIARIAENPDLKANVNPGVMSGAGSSRNLSFRLFGCSGTTSRASWVPAASASCVRRSTGRPDASASAVRSQQSSSLVWLCSCGLQTRTQQADLHIVRACELSYFFKASMQSQVLEIPQITGNGSGPEFVPIKRTCGRRYACKTIPKMPKRGKASPRYLLKLQQEVDAMQQIGASFDAVYLRVGAHVTSADYPM